MLSPKNKRNFLRVLPFGLIWLISGWIFLVVELAATGSFRQMPDTAIKMDFEIFIASSIALLGVGLLTGFIELKYLQKAFSKKRFSLRFFYKLLVYSLLFLLIVFITFPIAASLELDTGLFDSRVWEKYLSYFNSITHLSTALQLATSLAISLFYSEMSDFIGQSVLLNFFTGKYHQAVEEERIFMFLDMKSSTTIAEQLGHQQYFQLLRAYYSSFTDAIERYQGEIYQYVGDEIVLSWKLQEGKKNMRSINCFFAMKESLAQRGSWFESQFGVIPSFKAGIHLGKVTTGEIGEIKKEILFSGDAVNATARIQSLCNSYGVELIISEALTHILELEDTYSLSYLGTPELKGKEGKMKLYTLEI